MCMCVYKLIIFSSCKALDEIGHGVRIQNELPRQKRASSQGSSSSLAGMGTLGAPMMTGTLRGHSPVPPAPTSKPPTPPMARAIGTGSLSKGSREYRTPPAVAPPQVLSELFSFTVFCFLTILLSIFLRFHPTMHQIILWAIPGARGTALLVTGHFPCLTLLHLVVACTTIPHTMHLKCCNNRLLKSAWSTRFLITNKHLPFTRLVLLRMRLAWNVRDPTQILVRISNQIFSKFYSSSIIIIFELLAPPSPGMMNVNMEQMPLPPPSNYGSLIPNAEPPGRVRSMSPPPPPLPTSDDPSENGAGNRRRVLMPVDADLPGWVPKDYIDKGINIKLGVCVFNEPSTYHFGILQLSLSMTTMPTRKMN